ncbi:hypothetical protein GCM10025868_19260 [Angustibacter aerolatus]|uniref:Uncharacterized protein n=1 Tax=Angustibacter aerolatus TaxID=1162965 RepID=A0ABQ6JIR6_9ACTN|nr:hypothetical protein GCM10025868_19260 [Angustibacter aerolatus]
MQGSPAETLLGGVQARRISDYDHPERRAERESWVTDTEVLDRSDALGAASLMLLTLAGGGPDGDVLLLVRGPDSPRHTEADLEIAVDLTRRAGLIIDNARLYEREHAIAATLQSSLLPVLPDVPGLQVEARYQAAASGAYVGGDFYEVIPLPGGRSAWPSATSSATTCWLRRPWGTCAGCCAPAPGTSRADRRPPCSSASTTCSPGSASPRWPRWSTPGSTRTRAAGGR